MSAPLKVRKLPFTFAEGVRFNWHPENPAFGRFLNSLSFLFVGFEQYIIKALRDAAPLIKDPAVKIEARLFLEQEAQHSVAHSRHIKALTSTYPGLQSTLDKAIEHFDQLYRRETTAYHLAYIADLESTFTPTLSFAINNRRPLFEAGDANVSSLFLWHAVEEIEHRASAFVIYNEVVGNTWFRLARLPSVRRHLQSLFVLLDVEFERHIPQADLTAGRDTLPPILNGISLSAKLVLVARVLACLSPWHNPAHQSAPPWFYEWMKAEAEGMDMTQFYGAKHRTSSNGRS
jgi:predicted metal-dependent hydrolase